MQASSGWSQQRLLSRCGVWASHGDGSLLVDTGSRHAGSVVAVHKACSETCGICSMACGTRDQTGVPHIARWIPTNGPPEKPTNPIFNVSLL